MKLCRCVLNVSLLFLFLMCWGAMILFCFVLFCICTIWPISVWVVLSVLCCVCCYCACDTVCIYIIVWSTFNMFFSLHSSQHVMISAQGSYWMTWMLWTLPSALWTWPAWSSPPSVCWWPWRTRPERFRSAKKFKCRIQMFIVATWCLFQSEVLNWC